MAGLLIPVVEGEPPGDLGQGPGHHKLRDADADPVGPCPAPYQDLPGLFIMDVHAGPFEDLQGGHVDLFAFLPAHAGVVGALHA